MAAEPYDPSDEALAALVQKNDHAAFALLMDRYQPKLLRYGRRFLAQQEPIDDAVQDVFLKVYQNIQSYDAQRPFAPWIYRIAHNVFTNELRRKSRKPLVTLDLDMLSAHTAYEIDPAGEEEQRQVETLINRGLDALPSRYREVTVLHYIENLSYQEIADVLHVPVGTVGIRLYRARQVLKKYVEQS